MCALSVNYLYDRSCQYRYFLQFEPVAMAGYSIYIYHVTLKEANRVRQELGLAQLPAGNGEHVSGNRDDAGRIPREAETTE